MEGEEIITKEICLEVYGHLANARKIGDKKQADEIVQWLEYHKIKFVEDLVGKNIKGNSIKVLGWEPDSDLLEGIEICKILLRPAIKYGKIWLDFGECIGSNGIKKLEN